MRIVTLPTRVDDATTTGSDASSDFVPRLRWTISLFRQVDVVVGPAVRDLGNGFINGSPRF